MSHVKCKNVICQNVKVHEFSSVSINGHVHENVHVNVSVNVKWTCEVAA